MIFFHFPDGESRPAMPVPQAANSNAPRPAFDPEAALARVEGDRALLRKMVGLFAMQWSKLGAEIATAGQHRDGAALELTAHKLERSVRSFGADEASRVAQELEARGRKSDFHDMEITHARMKKEIERLVNALEEFTKEIPCA
jgi:two-component system sensor histidine kinase/response regulator